MTIACQCLDPTAGFVSFLFMMTLSLRAIEMASLLDRSLDATATELKNVWQSPSEVISILMTLGGDIVQKALASLTGGGFVPICFSFGWVNYAFTMLRALMGDGRLMPEADYPCKVVNVKTGYMRDNKSWVIGRLLRDDEQPNRIEPFSITIYDTMAPVDETLSATLYTAGWPILGGIFVILLQLVLAAIPVILWRDWNVLLITGAGTLLAILTAALPQWKAEKFACRTNSDKVIAVTRGNGSNHVMVIRGSYNGLDLEDLAAGESPRSQKAWQRHGLVRRKTRDADGHVMMVHHPGHPPAGQKAGSTPMMHPVCLRGLPVDFYLTIAVSLLLALCWIALLINISSLTRNTWFLALVNALGMVQNVFVAGVKRKPRKRGINLQLVDRIVGPPVQVLLRCDTLCPNAANTLLPEFFPGQSLQQAGADEDKQSPAHPLTVNGTPIPALDPSSPV